MTAEMILAPSGLYVPPAVYQNGLAANPARFERGRHFNVACLGHGRPIIHELPADERQADASLKGFMERHERPGCEIAINVITAGQFLELQENPDALGNADVKQALQAAQTMTVTNLHSLASSATAGWQSAVVDNTANLYLDALAMAVFDFANTAPANSKGVYIFAYGGLESGTYSNPVTGAEGTLTLVDVTANAQSMPMVKFQPYTTTDEVAESSPFSIGAGFGGMLPPYWGLAAMNHSGAALAASANTMKYRGIFCTVV